MRSMAYDYNLKADRVLLLKLPNDIIPGKHKVILVIDEQPDQTGMANKLPAPLSIGSWPKDLSLKRKDIYSENGR